MILYLDTNVLVYSIAANDELREPTQRWLDWHTQQPGALLVTSRLTVLEALVGPIKTPIRLACNGRRPLWIRSSFSTSTTESSAERLKSELPMASERRTPYTSQPRQRPRPTSI